ncbi:hypothetical protein M0802_008632 [Mischocyttarus mexicanus]|nr:hypothetical protein M0802_008632 [Mischocyttarus mexicanus]
MVKAACDSRPKEIRPPGRDPLSPIKHRKEKGEKIKLGGNKKGGVVWCGGRGVVGKGKVNRRKLVRDAWHGGVLDK